jgi:hypothetical protein
MELGTSRQDDGKACVCVCVCGKGSAESKPRRGGGRGGRSDLYCQPPLFLPFPLARPRPISFGGLRRVAARGWCWLVALGRGPSRSLGLGSFVSGTGSNSCRWLAPRHVITSAALRIDRRISGCGTGAHGSVRPLCQNPSQGLFTSQKFWRNATVAVSLLFGKYCLIMV